MADKLVAIRDVDPRMHKLKKTNLGELAKRWNLCMHCAACYYHGPMIPHNWLELPPEEWAAPMKKCPSYEHFGFKAYTPNGRLNLATMVFSDKDHPISEDLMEVVYTCDACGMCNSVCPTYRPVDTILALRETLVKRGAERPSPVERMDRNIRKRGNLFGAKTTPHGNIIEVPAKGKNMYFAGCNGRFIKQDVVAATLKSLQATGIDIAYLGEEEQCCGFVPGHDGNTALYEEQASVNVKKMKDAGMERIIVSCAHCLKAWKIDYPRIDGAYTFEVVHIAEIYSEQIHAGKLEFKKENKQKVTYHDPCFLGRHGGGIYEAPRTVIRKVPGIELQEMERNKKWSYCCGSGGKISSAVHPEMAAAAAKDRFVEAKEAADTIVTACTTCTVHMEKALKQSGMEFELYDLPVFVAEAMGIGR